MLGRLLGKFTVLLLCAGFMAFFASSAGAVSFDLGAAAGYAGLGLNGVPITISSGNTVINGSVGVGPNGSLDFSGGGQINGHIDKDPTATVNISGGSSASGGVHTINLTPAVQDALAAAAAAAALSPTQTLSSITNANSVITGNGGTNVIQVTGDINLSSHTFTLSGSPSDEFIFNVGGAFTMSGGSKIVLQGGVLPERVLFNFTGNGKAVNSNGNSDTVGVFLNPNGDIIISGGVHNSSFIAGGQLKFQSGPNITAVPVPAPLVATLGLLGLVGLTLAARRRNGSSTSLV